MTKQKTKRPENLCDSRDEHKPAVPPVLTPEIRRPLLIFNSKWSNKVLPSLLLTLSTLSAGDALSLSSFPQKSGLHSHIITKISVLSILFY